MTHSNNIEFETNCRKLEQFLYVHDIFHTRYYKDADGMTVWVYYNTPYLRETVEEYRKIAARRERVKGWRVIA